MNESKASKGAAVNTRRIFSVSDNPGIIDTLRGETEPRGTVKMVLDIFEANGMPEAMKKRFLDTAQTSVDTALLMMNDHLDVSEG